jgi:uncharacterized protein YbjT (DUF2867 family)
VSHLNASHSSKSQFYRAKAEGEDRVRAAFPNATIVRPSAMYGYEDKLLNNIASTLQDASVVAMPNFVVPQFGQYGGS